MSTDDRALERARRALARLEKATSRVPCLDLVRYRGARLEAVRRGHPIPEHAPGVPAADPAEQPPIAALLRGEQWLAAGCPGGLRGLVCALHWELMQDADPAPGLLRAAAGWAKGPGGTRVWRRFPEARSIPSQLAALEDALHAERDPILAAAHAYARLFLLHAFPNGNGRVVQAVVPIVLRQRGVLTRPCLVLGATFDRPRFVALIPSGEVQAFVAFALSAIESAATSAADACTAIHRRLAADARRLPDRKVLALLRRLAEGALPLRDVGAGREDAMGTLRKAGIVRVVPGLFAEPVVYHVGLARIVAATPA